MEEKVEILPAFSKKNIPIVLAADNNYVPIMAVMLSSLVKASTRKYNYDILVFNKDISLENQERIHQIVGKYDNFSLRFIDLTPAIKNLEFRVFSYYSVEIYFRLFMPYLLTHYSKAIYLDCDLIVLKDVAELWEINISSYLVGAIRDIGVLLHYYTKGKIYIDKSYFINTLVGVNPDHYFNSGVLLMNLEKFRQTYKLEEVLHLTMKEKWHFPDQDVLNILCADNAKLLSSEWNTVPETPGDRKVDNILACIPEPYASDYVNARKKPSIVHYALREKPWLYTCSLDPELFNYFWDFASETSFFNELIFRKNEKNSGNLADTISIIKKYTNSNLSIIKGHYNIHYIINNIYLGNIASIVVKYECAKISNNAIVIDGFTMVPDDYSFKMIQFYFEVNGKRYLCKKFSRSQPERYKNEILSIGVGFQGTIPFDGNTERYSISLICEFDGIVVQKNRINYSRYFILDKKYKQQYYHINGYAFSIQRNKIVVEKCGLKGKIIREIKFYRELWKRNNNRDRKAISVRLLYWILKLFKKKEIWLVGDNYLADDNGFAFFKYLREHHKKDCIAYFVMSKENERYEEIKSLGHIVERGSRIHKWLVLYSDFVISSVVDEFLRKPYERVNDAYRDLLNNQKFIFLQHGITTQDQTREHNKYVYNPRAFITAAIKEYQSLVNYEYYYTSDQVLLTGFPRFDLLYHDEKKYVTIMPTWRRSLRQWNAPMEVVPYFQESQFYKFYNSLLNNKDLQEKLSEKGYQLCVCMHPLLKKSIPLFIHDENPGFKVLDMKYREVFAQSSLIVSDYSSAIFDFLYLRKPIIYTQFDKQEFFENHVYSQGYLEYERDGFGEVEYDLQGTINRILEYVDRDCKMKNIYRTRVDEFFAFSDQNNSQRVFEAIRALDK